MPIDQDTIASVARLARIRVAPDQIPALTARINTILAMVDQMAAVDTDGVEPMANPFDARQRLREDAVTETDQRAAFLAIAPATEGGLYLVPKVID